MALHLGLVEAGGNLSAAKVEVAYKKALAKYHPDRSTSRGDDLAGRCKLNPIQPRLTAPDFSGCNYHMIYCFQVCFKLNLRTGGGGRLMLTL
jgi:hypothetical protein